MIGIYKVVNKKTKKTLIFKSIDVKASIRKLKYRLRNNIPQHKELQLDWNINSKYFTFDLITECKKEDLNKLLKYHKELEKDNLYSNVLNNHPWKLYPVVINLAPKTELILDADGDLLPLKFCIQCELHKLEDSFIKTSFYCRDCRQLNDDTEKEIEEILCNIIM